MHRIPIVSLLVITAVFGQSSCNRKKPTAVASPPPPKQTPTIVTKPQRLAPEGTYFVRSRLSVTTQFGVTGLPPGTRVRVLRPEGKNVRITDGQTELSVDPAQLTNDLDEAERIAATERERQRRVSEIIAQRQQAHLAQQAAQPNLGENKSKDASKQQVRAPASSNPLESPAYNATNSRKYTDQYGRTYWIDISGKRHYD